MKNWNRIIPYISLGLASLIVFGVSQLVSNNELQNVLTNIFSSSIFFFIVYLFYDLIRQAFLKKEKKYLVEYIKNKISNDIFVALYFLKKIIHGYNLDSNKLKYIYDIVNYSKNEILNLVKNQNYLGFQIFKNADDVRSLFGEAINDNLILKYSTHIDSISILRIVNNLAGLESILQNENNLDKCAESGIEYIIVNGKNINPENDDKYLLLKKTTHSDRFVVYDSGYFEEEKEEKLLNRYVLKKLYAKEISNLLFETFSLMKHWLPEEMRLTKNENRFRIIKNFFNSNTCAKTKKAKIYVADIIKIDPLT
jgi:hypothetical protein